MPTRKWFPRKTAPALVPLAVSLALVAGCTGGGDPAGDYVEDGTFTYAWGDTQGNFNPYTNIQVISLAVLAYDSLIQFDENNEVISNLAEKWEADATSAEFVLRPGITCSDGTELTASAVADAINYASDPDNQVVLYGINTPTTGLTATADDATRTVSLELDEPFAFIYKSVGLLPIVCPAGLADMDSITSVSSGTGPYVLTETVPGQTYTFELREGYTWGPDGATTDEPGIPARVVVRTVEDLTTAANLLLSGEVNFGGVNKDDEARLDAAGLDFLEIPQAGAWLIFNEIGDRPTADVRVREALVTALDLDEVTQVATGGAFQTVNATGLVTAMTPVCGENTIEGVWPEQDIEAAGELLDEAGWIVGGDGVREKDGVRLTLDVQWLGSGPATELIAERWKAIGVDAVVQAVTGSQWGEIMFGTSDYDVSTQGFNIGLPSQIVNFLSGEPPTAGTNVAGIQNEEYNRLTAEASQLAASEGCELWNDAERALWASFNPVPIANTTARYYLSGAEADNLPSAFTVPTSLRVLR